MQVSLSRPMIHLNNVLYISRYCFEQIREPEEFTLLINIIVIVIQSRALALIAERSNEERQLEKKAKLDQSQERKNNESIFH